MNEVGDAQKAAATGRPRKPPKAMLIGFAAVLGVLLASPYVLWQRMHATPPPDVLGDVPAWALTSQTGAPFGSQQLVGKPYVVSFFFTSCPSICPKIMGAMAQVQKKSDDLALVSITVDPLTDTPEVLRKSMSRYGVDPARWTLCTGTEASIRKVIVDGFKTYVGKKVAKSDDVYDIAHGARLVLVDAQGRARGHFSTDDAGVADLLRVAEQIQ